MSTNIKALSLKTIREFSSNTGSLPRRETWNSHTGSKKIRMMLFIRNCYGSCKQINWRLYLTLVLKTLLITVYTTVRVHLLGNLPSSQGFDIASQAVWLNLMFEIMQEGLTKPLYHTVGSSLENKELTINKLKSGFCLVFSLFFLFCVPLFIFTRDLLNIMDSSENAYEFIRLELVSNLIISLNLYLEIFITLKNCKKVLLFGLFIRLTTTIIFDVFFLSELKYSLNLGVKGVAFSNIGTHSIAFLVYMVGTIYHLDLRRSDLITRIDFGWFWDWARIGIASGLDSLIRNLVYMLIILKSMNKLEESGVYWVTNGFIWNYLLLPYLPLAEVLRVHIASDPSNTKYLVIIKGYVVVCTAIVLLWAVSIPSWTWFFEQLYNSKEAVKNYKLTLILFPFYAMFLFNDMLGSVFTGLGRMDLVLMASILGNLLTGSAFVAVKVGAIELTLTNVALIFGGGLAAGFFIKAAIYYVLIESKKRD